MSGREDNHAHAPPVMNPFVGEMIATRYAWARPQLHHHVVALLAERLPAPIRALDLGCGTGLSTEPLTSWARVVVGVDVSLQMLAARANRGHALYVQALAERLPFGDRSFDLVTTASAVHWFGSDAIGEMGRVLNRRAFLVVYDVRFCGEMAGTEAFGDWMKDECGPRYGPVPKNEFAGSSVASIGFQPSWEAALHFDVPMPLDALVAYLMTHSERIAAVREARETEVQQETYLTDALRPFFSDAEVRQVGFRVPFQVFSR